MLGKIARAHYQAKGSEHLGCAQSVGQALRERFGLSDDFIAELFQATGGRAPQGYCGAVYAALRIAEERCPEMKDAIESYFKNEAGALTCREIRAQKKLTCADCVEKAADLLDR